MSVLADSVSDNGFRQRFSWAGILGGCTPCGAASVARRSPWGNRSKRLRRRGLQQPGIGGHVTPIFTAHIDWHRADADAFWGPSIHWNTYLECWVMLLNRAKDKDWAQEGIYVTFNRNLSDPNGWTKPARILDAGVLEKSRWYPQVIGTSAEKHETDKLAGRTARLFVAGLSKWEITFLKPGEQRAAQP